MNKEIEALLLPNEKVAALLHKSVFIGSLFVICIGILKIIFPQTISMSLLSAVGFICAGTALFFQLKNRKNTIFTWFSLILASCTILIGSIALVNQPLFMSPNSSVSFILVGIALLFSQFPLKRYFSRISQVATLFVAMISMFAVIGYCYQALSLYKLVSYAPMPLSSAITFTIVCFTLLSATSNHGYIKILTKNTPSSILALRLIFTTLTLPAFLGYLFLLSVQIHIFDVPTGVSLLVIVTILVFSMLVWINTRQIQRQDLENLIIKNELEKENITLKVNAEQLAKKALELEEQKGKTYEQLMAGSLSQAIKPPETGD